MEFAFVIPLVVLFLFGIIDFGLALNQKNTDTNLANIAVREAAVIGTTTTATCGTTKETSLGAWVACETGNGGPGVSVHVCDVSGVTPSSTYATGDPIKVVVTSNFSWLKLISGKVSGLTSTFITSATMRMEGALTGTNPFLSPTCSA